MNKKSKVRISIEILDSQAGKVSHTQEIEVDPSEVENLDNIEQLLLSQGHDSMRKVISKQMKMVSKKNLKGKKA
jgi:hypothetical protein